MQALRAGALAVHADGGGVAHAGHVVHDLLDVGRQHVLAAEDDDVLEAAGNEDVALRVDEAEVAGRSQPSALSTFAVASGLL